MKLNRRFIRSIRKELSFYASIFGLIIITMLLFYVYNLSGIGILEFWNDFSVSQKVEDAHFTTYLPITDEEIAKLEEEYNVILEKESYAEIDTAGITARLFLPNEKIDLYALTEGRDIQSDDEIIISQGYAEENGTVLGGKLTVGSEEFTVVGTFLRPDYLYMLENDSDSYKNVTTFYLAYVSEEAFAKTDAGNYHYLVIYNDDNESDFRLHVHDTYIFAEYVSAKNNERILMVSDQAQMFVAMSYIMLAVVPLFAALLIVTVINRKVKSEQRLVGILYSLGYRKSQLMAHYIGYALIPAAGAAITGTGLAVVLSKQFAELGLADYEPMPVNPTLQVLPALAGIIIPILICGIACLLSLNHLLNKDPAVLLKDQQESLHRFRNVLKKRDISFRIKFAVRSVLANPGRSFVVIIGILLGDLILLVGLADIDSVGNMAEATIDQLGTYQNEYVINSLLTENTYGGEAIFAYSLEDEDGLTVSLIGCDANTDYLNITTVDGDQADLEDGFYITNLLALKKGWKAGDRVTLIHPFTFEELEIEVKGILANSAQRGVYTSAAKACEMIGFDSTVYNAILSVEELNIPNDLLGSKTDIDAVREQAETIMNETVPMIWVLLVFGVLLCFLAIFTVASMIVRENRKTISMLKILGYRDGNIDRLVTGVYLFFLPAVFILSIPLTYRVADVFWMMLTDYNVVLITTRISLLSLAVTFVLSVFTYLVSMLLLASIVRNVDMVKSLKTTDE